MHALSATACMQAPSCTNNTCTSIHLYGEHCIYPVIARLIKGFSNYELSEDMGQERRSDPSPSH